MTTATTLPVPAAPSRLARADWIPLLLAPVLALLALPLVGATDTWITLTVAGLAMGMIVFIIASGLTLIFGLMDVLNFGHGLFIAIGGFVAMSVLARVPDWVAADSLGLNLAALALAMAAAMLVAGACGWIFERVLIRRVYGAHLMQILITMGGMVVGEELIKVVWGPEVVAMNLPATLVGSTAFLGAEIEKYRVLALVLGVLIFIAMTLVLTRTKIGLLVRAGVQDREMVESLGYRIRTLFVGVFVVGSALAGLGGVMWGLYQQQVVPQMGAQVNTLIFIVIIIGGLGSTGGSFLGAILVGLLANYTGYLYPKVALVSNILLMMAILAWRPSGIFNVSKR
jgi:branched-chain amino acid transport system permease protein